LRSSLALLLAAILLSAGPALAVGRSFNAGSLIIPMDNCYQRDLAQNTVPKELAGNPSAYCAGMPGANSVLGNGARRAYGLIWHLLNAGIPLYWIVDPNKDNSGVDSPDLTINTGSCVASQPAVTLVDQSVPASYCGLDPLHPLVPSIATLNTSGYPSTACQHNGTTDQNGNTLPPGTFPLGTGSVSQLASVSYRGGPFVIDSKDAAQARDIMAWYFSLPPVTNVPASGSPLPPATPIYVNPPVVNGLFGDTSPANAGIATWGAANQYVNPGHHPLHWSQFAPSSMVPLYPPEAFTQDVGLHTMFAPCVDPCLCPYTTWDPTSSDGHVDPWTNTTAQDEITYATVNVHQAQVSFFANVNETLNTPMGVIALAGVTDPVHINTFRFYLEEAGLEFGPCNAPPAGWQTPTGGPFWSVQPGVGDLMFDSQNYPYPGRAGGAIAPYSQIQASCAEGVNTDDDTLNTLNPSVDGGPPLKASLGGGPYGQVLDIIAPEKAAFRNIVTGTGATAGCGAPRYSQLWIPHWDAYECSGPTSSDPSGSNCPLSSAIVTTGPLGTYCPNGESLILTKTGYQCTYDASLVQYVLDATEFFVQHGGNLMAECLGASSLESNYYQGLLLTLGIDQTSTHFMTEWDTKGGMTGFWPSGVYTFQNAVITPSNLSAPMQAGAALLATACIPDPGSVTFPRVTPQKYVQPAPPPSPPHFVGWPGDNVLGPLSTGSTVALMGGRSHFNGTCPLGSLPKDCSVPVPNTQVMVSYAPQVHATGNASLTDPFLQIGDFYFQGVSGATQAFIEGANTGYPNPPTSGYAWTTTNPDTVVLIRGDPANALAQDTSSTGVTIHGDYWLKNHNSSDVGQGTVVYMQGDSFDGRPDGLRMIWSSILNLAFVPNRVELARSSPVGFIPDGGTYHVANDAYLIQGSFEQANFDYSKYTPIFSSASDATQGRWIFPLVRGHMRQYDLQDPNSCFLPANKSLPQCLAAVTGQGSNTTNFQQNTGLNIYNWDSSENYFNTDISLLVGTAVAGTIDISKRTVFTHLFQQQATGIGLVPIWLNPGSAKLGAGSGQLQCALFPNSCTAGKPAVACLDGNPANCVLGQPACRGCYINAPDGGVEQTASLADVKALLTAVNDANSGCRTLLADTCFPPTSTEVECLDLCWSQCLDSCGPTTNYPPFNGICNKCGNQCADRCNGQPSSACHVSLNGTASDLSSFRETCYPSLGGVDHSTPIVVGPAPVTINESLVDYTKTPPVPVASAQCRPTVAYVGAGDGMLHAIYLEDPPKKDSSGNACPTACNGVYKAGQEIWAFMPNQNLPILHTNGDCSRSLYVDGIPVAKDVFADVQRNSTSSPDWHTVLTLTMGQGGNHIFALDVTNPLAPVQKNGPLGACAAPGSDSDIAGARVILWEQGDPLDPSDPTPYFNNLGQLIFQPSGSVAKVFSDSLKEGPGFPTSGLTQPPVTNPPPKTGNVYPHYMGKGSTVFMGSLLGSGAQQDLTFVSVQNGVDGAADGYGRLISIPSCGKGVKAHPNCNMKDFSPNAGPFASHTFGPAGELVLAFDSVTGVPRSEVVSGQLLLDHFSMLYDTTTAGTRSLGNNDYPAPVLGVSLSGQRQTELLVVPDLDGQAWGVRPATLASIDQTASGLSYPIFDVQQYNNYPGVVSKKFQCTPNSSVTTWNSTSSNLLSQAAFANPVAFLAPGTCANAVGSGGNDPVVLLATGGVDWGPPASVIVALDLNSDTLQNVVVPGPDPSALTDSAMEPLPVQSFGDAGVMAGSCQTIDIATCQQGSAPGTCQGRVFGQPLVVGATVLYTTSTGLLTGTGSSLDQQNGDGTISALGGSTCTQGNPSGCSVCAPSVGSVDLVTQVGKVASGLTAVPSAGGTVTVFSASTTGLANLVLSAVPVAKAFIQKLVLQEWWLRPQHATCATPPCP
jgi:hypothetical protein